jgi:predicted TIM-barrel fold metal-dependent hydrolase
MDPSDHYVVISADGHAGADLCGYRPYLQKKWLEEFDAWSSTYVDGWADDTADPDIKVGVSSHDSTINWDSDKRQAALESEGIVAEVLFPNTSPPFFPSGVLTAPNPRTREEYERRWAGLKAHNRWLADFCGEVPGRRAGLAQVFLYDVDDAVDEIRWAASAGLRGVLLPGDTAQTLAPLYYPRYDAIWRVCEELQMPVNRHSAFPADPASEEFGLAGPLIGLLEGTFYAHRGLAHMIYSGAFDRFPALKFVLTEGGTGWILDKLRELNAVHEAAHVRGTMVDYFGGKCVRSVARSPGEYFASNCYLGASLITRSECATRHEIGIDTIMWGSDLPHREGSYPFTREALRAVFADVPADETRKMLGTTAAEVYRLDMDVLQPIADRIGPTVAEVSNPLVEWPKTPEETVHPGLFSEFLPGILSESA